MLYYFHTQPEKKIIIRGDTEVFNALYEITTLANFIDK